MIRLAQSSDAFPETTDNECLIRIRSLVAIYGYEVPFLHLYTDGEGAFLSLMDGAAVLFTPAGPTEEWLAFLSFHRDIVTLHTDEKTGRLLADLGGWKQTTGHVLRFDGVKAISSCIEVCETPSLPAVYKLLAAQFPHMAPFEAWYVDYSHRFRHGHCLLAAVMVNDAPVSVATTVAQTEKAAILGQVATHPSHRRQGYAAACLYSLVKRCEGKRLYILPVNDYAENLYISLGFAPCGTWAELTRM